MSAPAVAAAPIRRRRLLGPWSFPLLTLCAAAAALVVALIMVDRTGERLIEQEAHAAATAEQDYLSALAREEGLQALVETLNTRERLHGEGFRYSLTDAEGRPLAGAAGLPAPGRAGRWQVVRSGEPGRDTRWQVVAKSLPTGERLVVAQNLDSRTAFRQAVFQSSALAILLAVGASIAAGIAVNAMLLRRARAIADTAELIAAGDMSARVAVHEPGDVFDRLGGSVNLMLSRIEELMTGLRTVTDSLAHDLRTPLGRLKGALQRAMAPGLDEEARLVAVEQAYVHVEHTLATFSALLDIAQAEAGLSRATMADVDLVALVSDLGELFGPLLEDAGQSLELVLPFRPVHIRGHELLLRQAVGNLLHNASRHAGPGASVTLSLDPAGAEAWVTVADDGPGIPATDRDRVQERFVRLDKARTTSGAGLGLAIVAACAKLHDGSLALEDNEPGLKAILKVHAKPRAMMGGFSAMLARLRSLALIVGLVALVAGPPTLATAADMHLVIEPARAPGDTLAVFYSGDGGWAAMDEGVARELTDHGVAVVGVNSLRYFAPGQTPAAAAQDLATIITNYSNLWGRHKVVLIGYSFGAGAAPLIADQLPPAVRAKVKLVALLAPLSWGSLHFTPVSWIDIAPPGSRSLAPAIAALKPTSVLCIYGEADHGAACRTLPPDLARGVPVAGGHHLGSDYHEIGEAILKALG